MSTNTRKAKVTDETILESRQLRAIWDSTSHPGQAEFGEMYDVGNQSAVGQFLRGETPLSLKAAAGFAQGLSCKIADFSPRLADLATNYAALSGLESSISDLTQLSKAEMQLVLLFRKMDPESQMQTISQSIVVANASTNRGASKKQAAQPETKNSTQLSSASEIDALEEARRKSLSQV